MQKIASTRRTFLTRAFGATLAGSAFCRGLSHARAADASSLDFQKAIQPTPRSAKFILDDWYIWCGAPTRTEDGVYHLLYSRWPRKLGHYAWVTHSEIAHATAPTPVGPFKPRGLALGGAGGDAWDAHVTHNPTLVKFGGKFYLYYMGNRGTGPYAAGPRTDETQIIKIDARWWNHRNNQRIGVAVADHPAGPWKRFDKPLIDVNPAAGSWDHFIASNPAATATPEGKFVMMYKTVADGNPPFGGQVLHAMAFADGPTGPFKRHADPILTHPTIKFPAEDPFLWHQDGRFWAIIKDHNAFLKSGTCLALIQSADALRWEPAPKPLVCANQVKWQDGMVEKYPRMERPQLLIENGRPTAFYCAVDWDNTRSHSANIAMPLKWT